jgi:hypothetical protein
MKFLFRFVIIVSVIVLFDACDQKEIDDQKPEIDLTFPETFPLNCDTIYFGESFTFKALFKDNTGLGSFSLDIHHNFDQHSHSTEINQCEMSSPGNPVNPFVFIKDFTIPNGLKEYEAHEEIVIPAGDGNGHFDAGDYHLFISLTDREGWAAQKGLSIKMLKRP